MRVGPINYRVEAVKDLSDDAGQPLLGQTVYRQQRMCVAAGLPTGVLWVTLWHEVLHALSYERSFDLDEGVTDALAHGIVQVLQDNPWMGVGHVSSIG